MKLASSSTLLFFVVLGACGGSAPESKTPEPAPASSAAPAGSGAPAAAGTAAPSGPAKPWKEMSIGEKKMHMKTVVMPKMAPVFQSLDAKTYGDFSCVHCHGNGAKNGNFVMPNPQLPKLQPANGFKKHMDEKPQVTKHMMEKVMPEMIAALGVAPYDPKTHQGFGCNGCHVIEK